MREVTKQRLGIPFYDHIDGLELKRINEHKGQSACPRKHPRKEE